LDLSLSATFPLQLGTLEPSKLADVLVVAGDVAADISLLERRERFIAVMQGGLVKAGQMLSAPHSPKD
jgi:imidazolonepropionase-like amidohydrolase